MKTYVVYEYQGGKGAVYMTHEQAYDTAENLKSLTDYISKNYLGGKFCIIVNMIPLKEEG